MQKNNSLKKQLLTWLFSISIALAMISITVLIILNSTFLYGIIVDFYELPYETDLTRQALIENYQQITTYLQLPWIQELHMPHFYMSETGRIHFHEVKLIIQTLYLILIITTITWAIATTKKVKILPIFNNSANLLFIISGILMLLMAIDFSQTFVWFHRLLFNNQYWIFNPITDPVILALPEELFLILGILACIILFVQCLLIKCIYLWKKSSK